MSRYVRWLANAVLFVLSCFLVANTANSVFAALLTRDSNDVSAAPPPAPLASRSWSDREIILTRNLFNASLLAPTPRSATLEPIEDLEATKLPLSLLGTVAAVDPKRSWAAVEDLEGRKTLILQVDDPVKRGAKVLRIERRRIVLLENGAPRELALDEKQENQPSRRSTARGRSPRRDRRSALARKRATPDRSQRARQVAKDRFEVPREEVEKAVRNPASIFSQAQIQPKYEGGEMIGMQVNAVRPGSIFQEIGVENGEIITEVNGIPLDDPEETGKILTEFAEASDFTVVVEGEAGTRTLTFTLPEED